MKTTATIEETPAAIPTPNTASPKKVQSALDNLAGLQKEISQLNERQAAAQNELQSLVINGNLEDEKVLARIARLQIFTSLFPARIAAREATIGPAHNDLLELALNFCSQTLRPLLSALMAHTRIKVGAGIKQHLTGDALELAITNSTAVQEMEALDFAATLRGELTDGGAIAQYAADLLTCWNKALVVTKTI